MTEARIAAVREALQSLDAALNRAEPFPLAYLARAELHERRGDAARARSDYAAFAAAAAGTEYAAQIPDVRRRIPRLAGPTGPPER